MSLLDTRYIRAKSPRSRQYLIRAPHRAHHSNKQSKLGDLVAYRTLLSTKEAGGKEVAHR